MFGMSSNLVKNTPARSAITQFLSSISTPVDVAEIINFLHSKKLNTNKVTVYRTIDFLLKNGIITRLEFGEGKFRYELNKTHHHHLVCQNCGKVEDVEGVFVEELEKKIRSKKGFLIKSHSLEFFGLCQNCQK